MHFLLLVVAKRRRGKRKKAKKETRTKKDIEPSEDVTHSKAKKAGANVLTRG